MLTTSSPATHTIMLLAWQLLPDPLVRSCKLGIVGLRYRNLPSEYLWNEGLLPTSCTHTPIARHQGVWASGPMRPGAYTAEVRGHAIETIHPHSVPIYIIPPVFTRHSHLLAQHHQSIACPTTRPSLGVMSGAPVSAQERTPPPPPPSPSLPLSCQAMRSF